MEKITITVESGEELEVSYLEAYLLETESELLLGGYDFHFDFDIEQMIQERKAEYEIDPKLVVEVNHLKLLQKAGCTVVVAYKKPNDEYYSFFDAKDPDRPNADTVFRLYQEEKI